MGRELKRKQAKKNKDIKKEEELDINIKGSTILTLIISTIIIILALYYAVAIFITKEINISWINNDTNNSETSEIENKILAKNTFNQKDETYYVYFYDFKEEDELIAGAMGGLFDASIYRVDTGSALNKNYVVEENSNRNVTSISDLKVKNPTLIKVSADKVTDYYEGSAEILDFLD